MEKIENGKNATMLERSKVFWKKHQKTFYFVGGILVVCVGGYYLVKYLPCRATATTCVVEEEKELLQLVANAVSDSVEELEPILERETRECPVRGCIVNLPSGWKASERALANAARDGVLHQLGEGQTYREGFSRTIAA